MNGIYYELCKKDIFHELCKWAFKCAKYAKLFARRTQDYQKLAIFAQTAEGLAQTAEICALFAEECARIAKDYLKKSEKYLEALKTANFKEEYPENAQDLINCIEISVQEAKEAMKQK